MRFTLLGVCALFGAGVFASVFLAICRAHAASDAPSRVRRGLARELLWAAIPCLTVIAAVTPAAIKILLAESGK
jgi:heme/copper-type cytochrome/quinol oxidase subunit 2